MGTFFGFKKITVSPRRDLCDAERRTTNPSIDLVI